MKVKRKNNNKENKNKKKQTKTEKNKAGTEAIVKRRELNDFVLHLS